MSEKISVIVPCYNVASYIPTTVRSILEQTYRNMELILVDDGSEDETGSILDCLKAEDERIVVIHKENGGVTSARLAGVEASTGDWIGFVDGDDVIEPDMYRHLLDNAHKYHADISHCGYQMVYPSKVVYYYNTSRLIEQDKMTGLYDLLSGAFIEPGLCNKLYNKTLFQSLLQSNVMDFSIHHLEDLLMNYYLFQQSKKSIYEDFCPYHYLLRKGSACISPLNKHKLCDGLKVLEIIKNDLSDEKLIRVINSRISSTLINLATHKLGREKNLIKPVREVARRKLRKLLPTLLKNKYSFKTKFLSLWCTLCPWSYQIVHLIYNHLKGNAHAYEVK